MSGYGGYGGGQGYGGSSGGYGQQNPYASAGGNPYAQHSSNTSSQPQSTNAYGGQQGASSAGRGYGQQSGNSYGQPAAASNPYSSSSGNPYGQAASNPYSQQSSSPYGQQSGNPYGQSSGAANPYGQPPGGNAYGQSSGNPYGQQTGNPYGQSQQPSSPGGYGQPQQGSENIPMGPVGGARPMGSMGGAQGPPQNDRSVLNDAREIQQAVEKLERDLDQLRVLQQRAIDDPDSSSNSRARRELDSFNTDVQALATNLTSRMDRIKKTPGAGAPENVGQVNLANRRLTEAVQKKIRIEAEYDEKLRAQTARQVRIVNPDATDEEIKNACNDPAGMQVFSQALLQSDRRGQSQSVLRSVQGRHEAIQKIVRDMTELNSLMQVLAQAVEEQQVKVEQIDQSAQNTVQHVAETNVHLDQAIVKARSARKKKWWCLGIVVAILVIAVIVILVVLKYIGVLGNTKSS